MVIRAWKSLFSLKAQTPMIIGTLKWRTNVVKETLRVNSVTTRVTSRASRLFEICAFVFNGP